MSHQLYPSGCFNPFSVRARRKRELLREKGTMPLRSVSIPSPLGRVGRDPGHADRHAPRRTDVSIPSPLGRVGRVGVDADDDYPVDWEFQSLLR